MGCGSESGSLNGNGVSQSPGSSSVTNRIYGGVQTTRGDCAAGVIAEALRRMDQTYNLESIIERFTNVPEYNYRPGIGIDSNMMIFALEDYFKTDSMVSKEELDSALDQGKMA